jgi:hypothetical protein
MSETNLSEQEMVGISREEMNSALFAQMVIQQANMAMLLMGKVPHPQTGETMRDIEASRLFIDQLEMLETKTKGNLTKEEAQLLKQSLMSLRMAFVEAVESPAPTKPEKKAVEVPVDEKKIEPSSESAAAADADSKKKFTKKY